MDGGDESGPARVVIVGGGFAGLQAARALRRSDARVQLLDRRNHHVFQPLLYQVATAALSPADIAQPIRGILKRQRNCEVILAEVDRVDPNRRRVGAGDRTFGYDYLVLATGATHSYFGNPGWAEHAPGLKTLEDATEIRRRILLAFERAETEDDADARCRHLTFAIVGGGPTGVELAGAVKEIATRTIPRDFRRIDTRATRVLLLEAADRLLSAFDTRSGDRARRDLEDLGVEVRLRAQVSEVGEGGVRIGEEFIAAANVFWAAGVQASLPDDDLEVPRDRSGRVRVGTDLALPDHPEVFVVGDVAAMPWPDHDATVPGVAQGAIQAGRHAGRTIAAEIEARRRGRDAPDRRPFVYRDRGSMATIGRARAVCEIGRFRIYGLPAWLLWSGLHIAFLVGFRDRAVVFLSWCWNWLVHGRGARLILGDRDDPSPRG